MKQFDKFFEEIEDEKFHQDHLTKNFKSRGELEIQSGLDIPVFYIPLDLLDFTATET